MVAVGEDRSTEWETLRPLIATGFIIWGIALSLLVLGFMAFRLLIKIRLARRHPASVNLQRLRARSAYRLR
jgi:hypothetical protein